MDPFRETTPMDAKVPIRQSFDMNERIINEYLKDLDDADLLIRPVAGMNHIAWQLGHLIASERHMVEGVRPGSSPPLPDGFAADHGRESVTSDDPKKFRTKAEYLRLWKAQREATKALLDDLKDSDLDAPGPDLGWMKAPTVGWVFGLVGNHVLMHVGQWVGVRRSLDKPIAI